MVTLLGVGETCESTRVLFLEMYSKEWTVQTCGFLNNDFVERLIVIGLFKKSSGLTKSAGERVQGVWFLNPGCAKKLAGAVFDTFWTREL